MRYRGDRLANEVIAKRGERAEDARSMLGEDAFVTVWAEAQTRSLEQILNTIPSMGRVH